MTQTSIVGGVLLAGTLLLSVFFSYIYALKRQSYLLIWAGGWLLVALSSLSSVVEPFGHAAAISGLGDWLVTLAALLFLVAARVYARAKIPMTATIGIGVAAAAWAVAYAEGWVSVSLYLGAALLFFSVARVFWQEGRKRESPSGT